VAFDVGMTLFNRIKINQLREIDRIQPHLPEPHPRTSALSLALSKETCELPAP
jgi:hypothetical protein